jgi:calcium-binding protein CML
MGAVASICTELMKRRRAERHLDGRVAAALWARSVNSITMRLPRFKEGLMDIRDVFDHYGNVKPSLNSFDGRCSLLSMQMR